MIARVFVTEKIGVCGGGKGDFFGKSVDLERERGRQDLKEGG